MKRSRIPSEVNAGSMADIAFLLLIFFLVATTIENDKGITVQLPPIETSPPTPLPDNRVLSVSLNGQNELLVENELTQLNELSEITRNHLTSLLQKGVQPVISILVDRNTDYKTYIASYDAIKSAYQKLRNEKAMELFDQDYESLAKAEKVQVHKAVPMIISEADPVDLFE